MCVVRVLAPLSPLINVVEDAGFTQKVGRRILASVLQTFCRVEGGVLVHKLPNIDWGGRGGRVTWPDTSDSCPVMAWGCKFLSFTCLLTGSPYRHAGAISSCGSGPFSHTREGP